MDEEPALSHTLVSLLAALCNACAIGDKSLVKSLLESNTDLLNHMYNPLQITARPPPRLLQAVLCNACAIGDKDHVQSLIASNTDMLNHMYTLLQIAAQNDHFAIFKLIVAKSGGYNERQPGRPRVNDLPGEPLGPRRGDELLVNACLDGHVYMVDMLIRDRAGTGAGRSSFGESALHAAIKCANWDICCILLEYNKELTFNGDTTLLCAIHMITKTDKDMYPIIELLLECGGPYLANLSGWHDWTPLHYAVEAQNARLMFILLRAGANPFLDNFDGDTAWKIGHRVGFGTAETLCIWPLFFVEMGKFVQYV
jgi:ankyrin repeat protein